MRRSLIGLLVVLGVSGLAREARAQIGTATDPTLLFYGIYLPRQQAQALQPGPEASIAAITANRQAYAATNRNEMFDNSGGSRFDPEAGDFAPSGGARRSGEPQRAAQIGGNLNGFGPARYYGSKLKNSHPTQRPGLHKNYNVAAPRGGRGFSGGGGGGYGGVGLPGPR